MPIANSLRWIRSGCVGLRVRIATSASRIERSSSSSVTISEIRIEGGELAKPRDQPVDADALRGVDLEVAARPLAAIGELGARRLQLHEHVMRGAEQEVALFGEDQAARVAVKQRHRKFLLERTDLARDCRL